jgi:predicted nucleotidyltransferase
MRADPFDRAAWPPLPEPHAGFLAAALAKLRADERIAGVAAAGSFARGEVDEHSDLDLVVAVEPGALEDVMRQRQAIARSLGPLLASFVGEHVGEPRLLVCLYGPPLLHVDLKFVALPDAAHRVDENVVLFDRAGRLASALRERQALYPAPRPQWIEDRFWTWVHYLAGKLARGELFEVLNGLGLMRVLVFGPLLLAERGAQPNGVRRLEASAPGCVDRLRATVALHDASDCARALGASIAFYRELRASAEAAGLVPQADAEAAAVAFFEDVAARL